MEIFYSIPHVKPSHLFSGRNLSSPYKTARTRDVGQDLACVATADPIPLLGLICLPVFPLSINKCPSLSLVHPPTTLPLHKLARAATNLFHLGLDVTSRSQSRSPFQLTRFSNKCNVLYTISQSQSLDCALDVISK